MLANNSIINILALVLYWRYQDKKRTPLGNDQSVVDVPCGAALASRSTANAREGGCGARAAGGEPATGTLPSCYTCTAATRLKLRLVLAVYLLVLLIDCRRVPGSQGPTRSPGRHFHGIPHIAVLGRSGAGRRLTSR